MPDSHSKSRPLASSNTAEQQTADDRKPARVAAPGWWKALVRRGRIAANGAEGRVALPIWPDGASGSGMKVELETTPERGGTRARLWVTAVDAALELCELYLDHSLALAWDDLIVCNGFQSWTETARYRPTDRMPPMVGGVRDALGPLGDDTFLPYTGTIGELRSWSYTVIRPRGEVPLFLASMDDATAYTAFEHRTREGVLRIWRDVAGWQIPHQARVCVLDLWINFGDEDACLASWLHALGHSTKSEAECPAVTGWTSWYHHYTEIDERVILDNVEEMVANRVPLDVFQIDDGWQVDIGTWTPNEKFPRGMKALAGEIHDRGYQAGLWLAPFIAEDRSTILRDHPDWVLTDANGARVHAGFNPLWSGFYWALDAENEEVRAYAHESVRRALHDWDFDLVKLDFLFAAGLRARPGRPRAKQMSDALDLVRDAAQDKLILGCGAPLAPAFGRVDYCRIGADVSLGWEDPLTRMLEHRERPSTQMTIKNTLVRAGLSGRGFLCDPDVFLLRDENTSLSEEERFTLAVCNFIAGDVAFTSDDLSTYTDDKLRLLFAHFPARRVSNIDVVESGDQMVVSATVDGSQFRLFVNFGDRDARVVVADDVVFENDLAPAGKASFSWRVHREGDGLQIPAHGARVVRAFGPRVATNGTPAVVGSTGHLLPGAEVVALSWDSSGDVPGLEIELSPRARGADRVVVEVPSNVSEVDFGGDRLPTRRVAGRTVVDVPVRRPRWRPISR